MAGGGGLEEHPSQGRLLPLFDVDKESFVSTFKVLPLNYIFHGSFSTTKGFVGNS